MASKLLIIKSTRPSLDVPFWTASDEAKAAMQAVPLPIIIGERNIDGALKKVRTLFFATPHAFTEWSATPIVQTSIAEREAHNAANGIVEEFHVVELADYDPFAAPVAPAA